VSSQATSIAIGKNGSLFSVACLIAAFCLFSFTARAADIPTPPSSHVDTTDLELKELALRDEVQYAKTRLEKAQTQLSEETKAGNWEQLGRLEEEVNEWLAWYSVAQAHLAQVERQIAEAKLTPFAAPAGKAIIPGENLLVSVAEDRSFNGIYQVRRGGYIIMPQIGRIALSGKTLAEAATAIQQSLQNTIPKATVQVERMPAANRVDNEPVIYLAGEFRDPRPWRIPLGIKPTLVNVILSAGGITDYADLTKVRLMRIVAGKSEAKVTTVKVINVIDLMKGVDHKDDIPLNDGDVISIPATSHKNPDAWFFVVPT
jgi:protein involved in polysaccharide export with SLBB domain